jgi:hypothetical protein
MDHEVLKAVPNNAAGALKATNRTNNVYISRPISRSPGIGSPQEASTVLSIQFIMALMMMQQGQLRDNKPIILKK